CLIAFSWLTAYWFRFNYLHGGQTGLGNVFFNLTFLIIITSFYFLHKSNLYKTFQKNYNIFLILKSNFLAITTTVVLLYFFSDQRISRIVILSHFIFSSLLLVLCRIIMKNIIHYLQSQGKQLNNILLIGDGKQVEDYVKIIKNNCLGINITAWLDSNQLAEKYHISSHPHSSISSLKQHFKFDMIVVGYSIKNSKKLDFLLKESHKEIIPIKILPDLSYSLIGHHIEDFSGIPMIDINVAHISFAGMILKRFFDIAMSLFLMLFLSPLMILIAIIIKMNSKGSVFYKQERIGWNGNPFNIWKFRTMAKAKNNEDQTSWSSENEPRKTSIGKFLRYTSLDELPQLWNVFIGNMSLVGPRPERPYFVRKFHEEIPSYILRHKMKAGITGWAQINGWRGDTCLKKRIECDIYYIKNWSLWLDIKIILLTICKSLKHKNAY
ncbi:MAG: undecaprenyl-phosphate glucose phosphotransferase, partial [Halobacteriovoraceae bacterium]|nr:undecaprenyl-phosphate glucose phosphotransferase [Halobacteriovoraceae bacterium]